MGHTIDIVIKDNSNGEWLKVSYENLPKYEHKLEEYKNVVGHEYDWPRLK
jgi:hypothetical protein